MKPSMLAVAIAVLAVQFSVQAATEQDRAARLQEIGFYTSEYIGDDIAYEKVGCKEPDFPEAKTKREIGKVSENMEAWRTCYNNYVEQLDKLHPAGKAIPIDLQKLMSADELSMAKLRMAKVYDAVAADANDAAQAVMAKHDAWRKNTEEFVTTERARLNDKETQLDTMYRDIRRNESMNGPGRTR